MSSSSSSSTSTYPFGSDATKKLSRGNFILWQAQVLPAIKGTCLTGYLDGSIEAPKEDIAVKKGDKDITEPNPDYED
jgi:hypothetical protein